jgi:hypothetical protein
MPYLIEENFLTKAPAYFKKSMDVRGGKTSNQSIRKKD